MCLDYSAPDLGKSGIIIYVSKLLTSSQKFKPNCTFEEQLWIRFDLSRSHVLLVGCIYRSPSASLSSSTDLLCELFQEVCALRPSHLLIVRDFNFSQINWDTYTVNDVGLDTQCLNDFTYSI